MSLDATKNEKSGMSSSNRKDWKSAGDRLIRSALGRNAFIGELYDARRETLTSRSLFRNSLPAWVIQKRDITKTEIDYKLTENISDKFDLFKIEAELQVSFLLGLFKVEGSGTFLEDDKKSEESVSCSLLCRYHTVAETLFASFEDISRHLDYTALRDPDSTHVVVELDWGANCLLTLESSHKSETEKKDIEGYMMGEMSFMEWLINPKNKGKLHKEENRSKKRNDVSVKVHADFVSRKGLPTNLEAFRDFVSDIPEMLKTVNEGKGKPLSFALVPLSTFRKAASLEMNVCVMVKAIDESFLLSTVYLFEDIKTIKRKLYDLWKEIQEFQKYVDPEDMKNVRNQQKLLEKKESDLKMLISDEWLTTKTGQTNLKDLIKKVEKFKCHELQLFSYEDFLDECSRIKKKLKSVQTYLSAGCVYLGRGDRLTDLITNRLGMEFVVLVLCPDSEKTCQELHVNTCCLFLSLVSEKSPNMMYVILDLEFYESDEYSFLGVDAQKTRCMRWKDGRVISMDLYKDYLLERNSNFVKVASGKALENISHKPGNRVHLEMACPKFAKGSCNWEKVKWLCFRCKHMLEYGFDDYFYCLCGGAPIKHFEYRCSHPTHGTNFEPAEESFLKEALSLLRPLKELNILILGQSGVGKSTWINSIINYMSYDSMESAKEGGVICEIPVSFKVSNPKTLKNYQVSVGEINQNEDTKAGNSATQFSHTYTFFWEDRYVRLIDSPGLGDTRGIDQDKKNMENIVEHIRNFKELHGICILLKASDNRLNAVFSYCLKELLIHLHKSVARNIVFCFTNARASFYGPGQTSVLLEKLVDSLDVKKELSLGGHNMFFLDNEAFLFLCTLTNPEIQYEKHLVDSFAKSWEISLKETLRLFETINSFKPHLMQETLSLVAARNRILTLTGPIAEVSKTIQMNLNRIEAKKKEIQTYDQTIKDLKKKLTINEIHLEPVLLSRPRTVCTSSKCVEYHSYLQNSVTEIEYKTICHKVCYLSKVEPKTVGNVLLKKCEAMTNDKCNVCGCGYQVHMHMTFAQKRVEKEAVNKLVESNMKKEQSDLEAIQKFVKELEKKTEKYKKEQEILIQTSVKFGMFLKQNAISVYNDSVADYLQYLIQEEENKPNKSKGDRALLESLKKTLASYEAETEILQQVVRKCDSHSQIPAHEVLALEQGLYKLELIGKDIKKNVEASRKSVANTIRYMETPLKIKVKAKSDRKSWYNFDAGIFREIWEKNNH